MDAPAASVPQLLGLEDKVALIVGGGQGLGAATALALGRAGCHVAIADIDAVRAGGVAEQVRSLGRQAAEIVGDMLDPGQVDGLMSAAESALGGLDVLVTIVGQAQWVSFLETTPEDWALDQRRNLDYVFVCAQWAARSMVRRGTGGSIVAISSVDGLQSAPMHAAYGAAKAGLVNLVKTMAVELAPHGVRANAIAPGTIKTPRATAKSSAAALDERARVQGIPMGRSGVPEEVADAVLFLASDLARYITGVTLPVDGGWMAARLVTAAPAPEPRHG